MIAKDLLTHLHSQNILLATVESCTGGLLANWITDIAGASGNFWGTWVVYDNTAKELLGVPKKLIQTHGAVSPELAKSLAENALTRLEQVQIDRTLLIISTTGIAGPAGGTPEKPVGLCYAGVAISGAPPKTTKIRAPADLSRVQNKEFFANEAMKFALWELRDRTSRQIPS